MDTIPLQKAVRILDTSYDTVLSNFQCSLIMEKQCNDKAQIEGPNPSSGISYMYPFKNRSLDISSKVEVYRNLHDITGKNKYSIRQKGLVIGHANLIYMNDVNFVVNQKGRQKVIKNKQKNVHAFLRGFITTHRSPISKRITYNPYINDSFINHSGQSIKTANAVILNPNGVWI